MSESEILESFDLFSCQLVLNEIDKEYYEKLICEHTQCTPSSTTTPLFIGFAGGFLLGNIRVKGQENCLRDELIAMIHCIDNANDIKKVKKYAEKYVK